MNVAMPSAARIWNNRTWYLGGISCRYLPGTARLRPAILSYRRLCDVMQICTIPLYKGGLRWLGEHEQLQRFTWLWSIAFRTQSCAIRLSGTHALRALNMYADSHLTRDLPGLFLYLLSAQISCEISKSAWKNHSSCFSVRAWILPCWRKVW